MPWSDMIRWRNRQILWTRPGSPGADLMDPSGQPGQFDHSLIVSILGECSMALEKERIQREKEETELRRRNERLRADLLRSISHDLRTPLTSISGNASNLLSSGESFGGRFCLADQPGGKPSGCQPHRGRQHEAAPQTRTPRRHHLGSTAAYRQKGLPVYDHRGAL